MAWRRWFWVIGVGVVVIGVAFGVLAAYARWPEPIAPRLMQQIHAAFTAYSHNARGELYPPKAAEWDLLTPNMELAGPLIDQQPDADLIRAYLSGECGVNVCYTGYLTSSQALGMAFLDAYAQKADGFPDSDIRIEPGVLWGFHQNAGPLHMPAVFRIREGIERFLVFEINDPAAAEKARSEIPLLWEMPDGRPVPGGWVLYMDGRVEWLPYPGPFPMTTHLIEGLRSHMRPSRTIKKTRLAALSRPPRWYRRSAPEPEVLIGPLESCTPLRRLDLVHADTEPTVIAGEHRGYRVKTDYIELVLFPSDRDVDPAMREAIWSAEEIAAFRGNRCHFRGDPTPVYMGAGRGHHWFALASVETQEHFREDVGLEGGDDRLQLMITHRAFDLMPRIGAPAVPYLESVLNDEEQFNDFLRAVGALEGIKGENAERVLRAAFAPGNPHASRNADAVVESAASGKYPGAICLEAALDVLVREHEAKALARRTAQWVMAGDPGQSMTIGCRSNLYMVKALLRRLPREAYDKPLDELVPVPPDAPPEWLNTKRKKWAQILRELASEE